MIRAKARKLNVKVKHLYTTLSSKLVCEYIRLSTHLASRCKKVTYASLVGRVWEITLGIKLQRVQYLARSCLQSCMWSANKNFTAVSEQYFLFSSFLPCPFILYIHQPNVLPFAFIISMLKYWLPAEERKECFSDKILTVKEHLSAEAECAYPKIIKWKQLTPLPKNGWYFTYL